MATGNLLIFGMIGLSGDCQPSTSSRSRQCVGLTSQGEDGEIQRGLFPIDVGLVDREVRADDRRIKAHELAVIEENLRRTVEEAKLFAKLSLGEGVEQGPTPGELEGRNGPRRSGVSDLGSPDASVRGPARRRPGAPCYARKERMADPTRRPAPRQRPRSAARFGCGSARGAGSRGLEAEWAQTSTPSGSRSGQSRKSEHATPREWDAEEAEIRQPVGLRPDQPGIRHTVRLHKPL